METKTLLRTEGNGQSFQATTALELQAITGGLDYMALAQEAAAKLEDRGFDVKIVGGTINGQAVAFAVPVKFNPPEVEGITI